MRLKVLGSSGAEFPGCNPPAFLINGDLLLDGGTIGSQLDEREQWGIRNILITHSHLDHVKGIPFLADNIIIRKKTHSITLIGIPETLNSLRKNLLNNTIWPDFTKISAAIDPVIKLRRISAGKAFAVDGYTVRACRVNHTVPGVGYIVKDGRGRALLYTGDTGPTEEIWKASDKLDAAIIEVSFPNSMEELALKTGHLTAALLRKEMGKMRNLPGRIFVTHPKPQYLAEIKGDIRKLRMGNVELLRDGGVYEI